ncbi:hypothetical protein ACE6H2_017957 [Prunus campanulata]
MNDVLFYKSTFGARIITEMNFSESIEQFKCDELNTFFFATYSIQLQLTAATHPKEIKFPRLRIGLMNKLATFGYERKVMIDRGCHMVLDVPLPHDDMKTAVVVVLIK